MLKISSFEIIIIKKRPDEPSQCFKFGRKLQFLKKLFRTTSAYVHAEFFFKKSLILSFEVLIL